MKSRSESSRYRQIYQLGYAFASRTELNELIPFVIAKCREILRVEGVSVLLLDQPGGKLYFPYISEEDPEVRARLAKLRFSAGHGIAGAVLSSGHAEKVDDVSADPRFYSGIDHHTGFTTRSILAAPLISEEGPLGVIEVVNRHGGALFSPGDLALLEELAKGIAVAIRNAERFGRLKVSEQMLRVQVGALTTELGRGDALAEIVAVGAATAEVLPQMESAAAAPIPVPIEGEAGTGKDASNGAQSPGPAAREKPAPKLVPLDKAREKFEANFIAEALGRYRGDVQRAAAALVVSRATLLRKIKQYKLRCVTR